MWQDVLESLRSEDTWDMQVFDCTQARDSGKYFDASDDLRTQARYWRDRRNARALWVNDAHANARMVPIRAAWDHA
jgi:hypothetical protein